MRARLAMTYAGIKVEQREILLKDKPQAMLDASPKGTVPVLVFENGQVIDESLDIMLWALEQHDPNDWLSHQEQAIPLIDINDNAFKPWLDKYKYADRFPEHSKAYYRKQGETFLQTLETLLEQHTFLHVNQPSLTDYAIFPFIRQFSFVDLVWFEQAPYPKLQVWLNKHLQSNLFEKVMVKHPVWMQE